MLDDVKIDAPVDAGSAAAPGAPAAPPAAPAGEKPDQGAGTPVTAGAPAAGAVGDAPKADKGGTSLLDDVGSEPAADGKAAEAPEAKGYWPEDWRTRLAGEDEKLLKRLERFDSPAAILKSMRALEQKLSSGDLKKAFPAEGTPEEQAEWRAANGIPEAADKYTPPKIEGVEWSKDDAAVLGDFYTAAHEANLPQAAVDRMGRWYVEQLAAVQERTYNIDREDKVKVEDHWRAEWGQEYRGNLELMVRLLKDKEAINPGLTEALIGARTSDGRRLINNIHFPGFMVGLARQQYGDTHMPTGSAALSAHNSRKAELEKIMKTDYRRYYAEGLDKEFYEIMQREARTQR
jgi:hypothetical protein